VIKWGEFRDGGFLFEAFLPEHEGQQLSWVIRTSCRGHVVDERRIQLVWPPRFGPDAGDVARLESVLDVVIESVKRLSLPESEGAYEAGASEAVDPDPYVHAALHGLLDEYVEAEATLQLSPEQSAAYLDLDPGLSAQGLFPMAITPRRDARMRKLAALARLVISDDRVRGRAPELVAALMRDDSPAIRAVFEQAGLHGEGHQS
jgi:hypothetical protein